MQRLLPVAAAALLALVVWFLLGGDAPPKDEQDLAAPAIAGLSEGLESEDLESAPGDTDAAESSAEHDASERVALEASVAAGEDAASAAQLWQARIHLERIDGTVDEWPSGMVSYSIRQERGGQLFDGEVIDGVLSFQPKLRGDGAARFAASYGEFGDLYAWNEAESQPIGPETVPTVVFIERARTQLEVFEWGTERLIPEVDLVLGGFSMNARFHEPNPGPHPALWKRKASVPYAIEMQDLSSATRGMSRQSFLVGAPGYAWTSTTVEFGEPRHRVELQRGGSLRVVAQGLSSYSGLNVALLAEDSGKEIGSWSLDESGAFTLEGVRPGSILARVSSPDPTQSGHYIGEGRATVVAGTTTELRCAIDPLKLAPPDAFTVQVILELPTTWGTLPEEVTLHEQLAEGADADRRELSIAEVDRQGDPLVARLTPVELTPGRWRLSTQNPAWAVGFEVDQGGELRFAIPAPVDSTLEVIDAQTRERLTGPSVYWSVAYDEEMYGGLGFSKESDTPGLYSLRTPLCDIRIQAWSRDHAWGTLNVPRERLGGLLQLELERSQGVNLRLRISDDLDYGGALAWETELRAGGVDGENRVYGKSGTSQGDSHSFRFTAIEPGRHFLCVPEIPGFEPVEPIEIEILAGEFATQEIRLVKRP